MCRKVTGEDLSGGEDQGGCLLRERRTEEECVGRGALANAEKRHLLPELCLKTPLNH